MKFPKVKRPQIHPTERLPTAKISRALASDPLNARIEITQGPLQSAEATPGIPAILDKYSNDAPIGQNHRVPIEVLLRRRVTGGFIVAVLLTMFLSFWSWHGARRAEQDAYWVSHTYEVMATIQRTSRDVLEAETSARAFALSGQEPLLVHYQTARGNIYQDEDTLRHLTADNLSQQRRLEMLGPQVRTALEFSDSIIAKRRKLGTYPGGSDALEIEALIVAVRAITHDMHAEETRLLSQRSQRAAAGQRSTRIIAIAGLFLEVGFWSLAFFIVVREIDVSARARSQLNTLNAELEERVKERTASLQSEISDRRRAQEIAERLAAVVESSDDAIISKDLNGIITAWNRGAEKVFGYSSIEALGQPLLILLPTERRNEEADILARIQSGESVEHFETIRVRKDGAHINVSVTISPIRDSGGAIVGASKITRDITERKRAEAASRESEERFHAMLNGIPQLAWMAEADGNIFWYNQRWYDYTGTTAEQTKGWDWQNVHDPEFLPKVLDRWQTAIAEGTPFEMEFPLRAGDGHFGMFLTRVLPLKDANGRVVRWFGTNTDISERKQAELQLAGQALELARRAEELANSRIALETQTLMLQSVLDSIGEGLIAADREGHFLIWNNAAKKLMGRDASNLPTEQWTPHYRVFLSDGITPCPADRLPLVRALRGESVQMEMMVQNPEPAEGVFLEVSARPLKDHHGNVGGGVAVLRDITERKRSEAALARQAEELLQSQQSLETQTLMLQSVLDSISEGLVAADETGKFILWNPAARRIVGMGASNVPPKQRPGHYGTFLPDTVTPFPHEQSPLQRAIRGEASTVEMYLRNPELEAGVWIELSGNPLKGRDGTPRGGVVAFRDITQRKIDEREIRKLNEGLEERVVQRTAELKAANKELEAFTYSVSHDLRAPLRHISGFAKILVEKFKASLPSEAQEHLQLIAQGASRMGQLVDELLKLARLGRQALAVKVTALSSLVADVMAVLAPEIEGRQVEWKIGELPCLECDPTLIRQVFQNLISNALKYSRPRSPAVIEIGQTEKEGERVIFVKDNGVGFDMRYMDKLFGVFQRLHLAEEFEGNGIGLATVERIIKKHEGRVWVEAELDRGATFYFTLGSRKHSAPGKAAAATGASL